MTNKINVSMTVNGQERSMSVEPRMLLVDFLREGLGLTGTNIGCDTSQVCESLECPVHGQFSSGYRTGTGV